MLFLSHSFHDFMQKAQRNCSKEQIQLQHIIKVCLYLYILFVDRTFAKYKPIDQEIQSRFYRGKVIEMKNNEGPNN